MELRQRRERNDLAPLPHGGGARTKLEAEERRVLVELEYLPAYSPDFDPIEECISKTKAILHTLKAHTQRKLGNALKYAIEQVTLEDIRGWFRHCGYTYSLN